MTAPSAGARRAEALGACLPPLLVAAQHVAATVAQGVHGRRRAGGGDSFWQFRPFLAGDSATRIDWRQSARGQRLFVRETEQEAAQTVWLWRDGSSSMRWGSNGTDKLARADLLLLALAALLLRGGERVGLLAPGARSTAGAGALVGLADALGRLDDGLDVPPVHALPRHARVVLIGDMLAPLTEIGASIRALAATPARGHVLHLLDPAEATLPYDGRVRFRGLEAEPDVLIPQVAGVRDAYAARLAAQMAGVADLCRAAGWSSSLHRTDQSPAAALLGLYTVLAPQGPGR